MASYRAPREWEEWNRWLAAGLHGRSRWRLPILMLGALFAGGRRVVASWIRAAGVSEDYQDYYYFLQSLGRRWRELGMRLLVLVLTRVLQDPLRVLLAVDDSPTKRYGPQVQGAGLHHDPTPGPSGDAFCYGHVWVTLAVVLRHPRWGTIGLPLCAWLYVRAQDVLKLPKRCRWTFQTKLQQGADLVARAAKILHSHGNTVWCVADGAYAKRPFVQPLLAAGVTLVGRLRKDAALWDLPPVEKSKRRGRKRKYGLNRLSLAKRAAHRHGWQETTVTVYGREVVKRTKTFLATHRTFGGTIRVVIVQESTGPQFFFCTEVTASVREVIECFADRSAIEQAPDPNTTARCEGSLGERPAAGAEPVVEHRDVARQPVAAHADGTVGLGPRRERTGAPGRFAVGPCGPPPEPRRPPQSVTGPLLGGRIIRRSAVPPPHPANPNPAPTPPANRHLTIGESQKVQSESQASEYASDPFGRKYESSVRNRLQRHSLLWRRRAHTLISIG